MNATRCLLPAALAAVCLGCLPDLNKKTEEKTKTQEQAGRKVGMENQFGIVADADEFGRRRAAPNPNPNPIPQNKQPQFRERRVAGSAGNVGVLTDYLLDYNVATKQHADWKVLEKSTTGTVLGSAYFSAISRVSKANFERQMRIQKELNGGRWPTYKDYVSNLQKFRIDLAKLPPWQYYAYDDRTGKLFILEDPQKRLQLEGK